MNSKLETNQQTVIRLLKQLGKLKKDEKPTLEFQEEWNNFMKPLRDLLDDKGK